MFKLFNKLRETVGLRPFPEYEEVMDATHAMVAGCETDCAQRGEVSAGLRKLAEGSPADHTGPLSEISREYGHLATVKRDLILPTAQIRKDAQPLGDMHSIYSERKKREIQLKQNLEKTSEALREAEKKFRITNRKNPGSADARKRKAEVDTATSKKTAATTELEVFESKFIDEEKEYKKKVFSIFLQSIGQWAAAKRSFIPQSIESCDKIVAEGEKIGSYVDPDVEKIRHEIEELRVTQI